MDIDKKLRNIKVINAIGNELITFASRNWDANDFSAAIRTLYASNTASYLANNRDIDDIWLDKELDDMKSNIKFTVTEIIRKKEKKGKKWKGLKET